VTIIETERELTGQEDQLVDEIEAMTSVEESEKNLTELKKNLDDKQAALLRCRREIYVCFKLLGDLIQAEFAPVKIALDILSHMLSTDSDQTRSSSR
jgi:hypothetical protein